MALVRTMVVIPADTAVGAEVVVNNWGFDIPGSVPTTMIDIANALKAFYDSWATYRGSIQDWDSATIKGYDMSHPKPRVPLFDMPLNLSAAQATGSLMGEAAICLSFQAQRQSGISQRRRRGRVYLGPMSVPALSTNDTKIAPALVTLLTTAAQTFLNESNTDADWTWNVISEATGTPVGYPVHNGWIDNAFDTQRRRGMPATTRSVFTTAG